MEVLKSLSMFLIIICSEKQSAKTSDSLSGHVLMICSIQRILLHVYQNYSKSCGICERHSKIIEKQRHQMHLVAPIIVRNHCPENHAGSSKGMEAKAPLDCANKVWLHSELSAFVELICIDDNVSTRILPSVYLHRPGCQRPPTANQRQGHNKGKLGKDHPAIKFLAGLSH
jgi:hypothetical protein